MGYESLFTSMSPRPVNDDLAAHHPPANRPVPRSPPAQLPQSESAEQMLPALGARAVAHMTNGRDEWAKHNLPNGDSLSRIPRTRPTEAAALAAPSAPSLMHMGVAVAEDSSDDDPTTPKNSSPLRGASPVAGHRAGHEDSELALRGMHSGAHSRETNTTAAEQSTHTAQGADVPQNTRMLEVLMSPPNADLSLLV